MINSYSLLDPELGPKQPLSSEQAQRRDPQKAIWVSLREREDKGVGLCERERKKRKGSRTFF